MQGIDKNITLTHMVLGWDLNPHDTLFAGQAASYLIECGFLAVQSFLQSRHIVFLGLDGLRFTKPVHKGESIEIMSRIIYTGTTSVGVYLRLQDLLSKEKRAECFVSFVAIEEESGKARPHGMELDMLDETGKQLQQRYLVYRKI